MVHTFVSFFDVDLYAEVDVVTASFLLDSLSLLSLLLLMLLLPDSCEMGRVSVALVDLRRLYDMIKEICSLNQSFRLRLQLFLGCSVAFDID